MNALTTCNNCDAAEMVDGDPRGYCAECIAETDGPATGETKEWWAAIHRSRPIYINENGRHVCAEHIGHYARTFLQRRPNVRIFQTPTDHWIMADDCGIGCEDCGGRSFR